MLASAGLAAAQSVELNYYQPPAGTLAVGADPQTWGTTFTHVRADIRVEGGAANANPAACPGANAGVTLRWLPDPHAQCGLAGSPYDVYLASDGTWLYLAAHVYDASPFPVAQRAPSWWRRDSLEVRLVASGHAAYQQNLAGQPGVFIATLQRDGSTANNYAEIDPGFVEGVNWQRWSGIDNGIVYTVGMRVKLSAFAAANGSLPDLRLNLVSKNQIAPSSDADANRVWLGGDLANYNWPAQMLDPANWAAISGLKSAYGPIRFENRAIGNYNYPGVNADFGSYANLFNSWGVVALFGPYKDNTAIVESGVPYHHALQVRYRAGGYSGTSGAGWRGAYALPSPRAQTSFMVKFQPGFQFQLGGKLHGLCSSTCPSNGAKPASGFSVRFMWRPVQSGSGARLVAYVYHPEMPWTYGQDFPLLIDAPKMTLQPGGAGNVMLNGQLYGPFAYEGADSVAGYGVVRVDSGTWYRLDVETTVNTPGHRDGRIRAWIEGELALDVDGFDFGYTGVNNAPFASYGNFETFHGGEGTQWAPTADVYALFDDLAFWAR